VTAESPRPAKPINVLTRHLLWLTPLYGSERRDSLSLLHGGHGCSARTGNMAPDKADGLGRTVAAIVGDEGARTTEPDSRASTYDPLTWVAQLLLDTGSLAASAGVRVAKAIGGSTLVLLPRNSLPPAAVRRLQ
jgi:hypothetical protein